MEKGKIVDSTSLTLRTLYSCLGCLYPQSDIDLDQNTTQEGKSKISVETEIDELAIDESQFNDLK